MNVDNLELFLTLRQVIIVINDPDNLKVILLTFQSSQCKLSIKQDERYH